jgi:hypothetical protein
MSQILLKNGLSDIKLDLLTLTIFMRLDVTPKFYTHSYFPRVIRAWNLLPDDLKAVAEIGAFKRKLRTFFLQNFE